MPEFDSNDDPPRLSASGMDDSIDIPRLMPRFAPRMRQLAERRCSTRPSSLEHSVGPMLLARARGAARNSCAGRIALLGTPPRRRRRLWTKCHGRSPGSLS
jgi:hypothetical protein